MSKNMTRENRVSQYEVETGKTYTVEMGLYMWAVENEGHESVTKVTVTDMMGEQKKGHMCDVTFRCENTGESFTHHLDNGYVVGRAGNTEGVPDVTDVGKGVRYYEGDA